MSLRQSLRRLRVATNRRESKSSAGSDERYQAKNADKKAGAGQPPNLSNQPEQKGWHPQEACHHRIERFYWGLTAILTALAVAGAIATVIISNWTLEEAGNATKEARRQADEAKRQADVAQEAFTENDRPIFSVEFPETDVLGGTNDSVSTVKIQADNIGNKPGFIYSFQGQIVVGVTPPRHMAQDNCNWNIGIKTVAASSNLWVVCRGPTIDFNEAKQISEATKTLYFIGHIYYKSPVGAEWKQRFCYFWSIGNSKIPARMEVVRDDALNVEERVPKPAAKEN